jgi:hypothetical protein
MGIRPSAGFCHFQIHLVRPLHLNRVFTKSSNAPSLCRRQAMRLLTAADPEAAAFRQSMRLSAQGAGANEIEES